MSEKMKTEESVTTLQKYGYILVLREPNLTELHESRPSREEQAMSRTSGGLGSTSAI